MSIEVCGLCAGYGKREILHSLTFSARDGDILAILGRNGVGKSTLFKCLLGFIKATAGSVKIGGAETSALHPRELARLVAYIPQSATPTYNYTVLDTVLMGAAGRLPAFSSPRAADVEKSVELLRQLGIEHLKDRGCGRISGGERQLTLIARALFQSSRVLIMDEPTANLDYGNSFRVMERVTELGAMGLTVVFATHEPNHALRYSTSVLALRDGSVASFGPTRSALTEETLSSLYDVNVRLGAMSLGGTDYPVCAPYR